ncbi:2-dehydro-3-deoxyphosphooctonate aldolase [Flavobacterium aurantiibacter]|uniref:2-dehydro-3-deoxyphosphooctonate aldolase n=1 Tax=Flavobacterium aurantiibacter TaxID=2023067 RepID=A0A256A662_9FLAO|nr:2-dehydro-3-deoxyphosphooctonate aldolase [Flavobacterium aurantiibacter]OYQ48635.1 2-dehydro-3-deoxyphosphooctonate aldolase [Flavobacterium aurantiibacter]
MRRKVIGCLLIAVVLSACVSTKSTLKNVDENAPDLQLNSVGNFVITDISTNPKYGYDKDYPINVFFQNTKNDTINQFRFLNALAGPKGEKIRFRKIDDCCPFPSKRNDIGVGLLNRYEITWEGQKKPIVLYLNIFAKGRIAVPVGLTLKK